MGTGRAVRKGEGSRTRQSFFLGVRIAASPNVRAGRSSPGRRAREGQKTSRGLQDGVGRLEVRRAGSDATRAHGEETPPVEVGELHTCTRDIHV